MLRLLHYQFNGIYQHTAMLPPDPEELHHIPSAKAYRILYNIRGGTKFLYYRENYNIKCNRL
ncbi:hypothetical protein KDH_57970 [Dictyobacter sp. S3.2.2.5]|uniref:Uncharacterized protein n=1 Tax=Dictyobacter halimunensis TaxID=3026934 RepID=A0ABQ6G2C7_9CHLR|nr:hypothetical protein KDH_57970 [Dictyobacter sp. S3.2.2.5]